MNRIFIYSFIILLLACSKKQVVTTSTNKEEVKTTQSPVKPIQEQIYDNTFNELNNMLNGNQEISFKRAVFITENAYWNNRMNYSDFAESIDNVVKLAQAVKNSRELIYDFEDKKSISVYASVFSVMTDTLPIQTEVGIGYHYPYIYDFEDFWGNNDWVQMFVTKLLITKRGNCHSLPYMYKILVEEMGERAYLSLAPNHVYIKQRSKQNGWYNTELTSGMFPNDAWLMASGYVHLDAIKNGIYMDTLSQKQSIAMCMIDLAKGYEKKFGVRDGKFMLNCVETALKYFPNYINALLMEADIKQKLFFKMMKEYEVTYPSQMFGIPEAKKLYDEMEQNYANIHKLGYRKMPEKMYVDWLLSLKENRDKYENKKITNFTNTSN